MLKAGSGKPDPSPTRFELGLGPEVLVLQPVPDLKAELISLDPALIQ